MRSSPLPTSVLSVLACPYKYEVAARLNLDNIRMNSLVHRAELYHFLAILSEDRPRAMGLRSHLAEPQSALRCGRRRVGAARSQRTTRNAKTTSERHRST
jgi:hypothetical protein